MKKQYEKPMAEKIVFLSEDIITMSVQELGMPNGIDYNDADYDGVPDM